MIIYIDNEFKCHTTNDGTMTEIETDFFEGRCEDFIKGYRFVPEGKTWVREDGEEFTGEMISPWRNYNELRIAQADYEHDLLLEYEAALAEIENALEVNEQ